MQVIVQRTAFTQELRREEDIVGTQLFFNGVRKTNGDGGLNDHYRIWINCNHVADHRLDAGGVEIVGLRIVVSWCRDDNVVRVAVSIILIGRCTEI